MKYFYRINIDLTASIGSGTVVPQGFTEYIKGSEPQELIDAEVNQELLQRPKQIKQAIQKLLDTTAQSLKYGNIQAVGKYVGYLNAFQPEAEALGKWASEVWVTAEQIEADVTNGVRPMPTVDEVMLELPKYVGVV